MTHKQFMDCPRSQVFVIKYPKRQPKWLHLCNNPYSYYIKLNGKRVIVTEHQGMYVYLECIDIFNVIGYTHISVLTLP